MAKKGELYYLQSAMIYNKTKEILFLAGHDMSVLASI